jgi:hypothetical protein
MVLKSSYLILIAAFVIIIAIVVIMIVLKNNKKRNINALVIVEPRKHKHLKTVLKNFDELMPPNWDIHIFHGLSAYSFANEASQVIRNSTRTVYLKGLDVDNLDADGYNFLLKQRSFWDKVNSENILVFQTDTALCSNSDFRIEDFMRYNYIGCNTDKTAVGNRHNLDYWKGPFYGVGGLSFRKKSFMLQCIKDNKRPDNYPEDVFFSECAELTKDKPETVDIIHSFCTQGAHVKSSFGAHKISALKKEEHDGFYEYCHEASYMK